MRHTILSSKQSSATSVERGEPLGANLLWTMTRARPIAGTRKVKSGSCRVISMKASIRVVCYERRRDAITKCAAEADPSRTWSSERLAYTDSPNAH